MKKSIIYRLHEIDIKPILACNADCDTCEYRKKLYNKIIKEKLLSLKDWKKLLSDAKILGAKHLIISGGNLVGNSKDKI